MRLTYGNVDVPTYWADYLRPGHHVLDGETVELEPIMLVDGDKITTAADGISAKVTAEIVREDKGPKISIVKYKNKTGYRKRQGHRQKLTRLKVTGIQ